jgi:hypothetical protein
LTANGRCANVGCIYRNTTLDATQAQKSQRLEALRFRLPVSGFQIGVETLAPATKKAP